MKLTREVKVLKTVTFGYICDNCNIEIRSASLLDGWHQFTSKHNECGNDSHESTQHYHVCSPKCYFEMIKSILESELQERKDGEIDNKNLQFVREVVRYLEKLQSKIKKLEKENEYLRFMEENGLGEDDLKNDITYPPCEI